MKPEPTGGLQPENFLSGPPHGTKKTPDKKKNLGARAPDGAPDKTKILRTETGQAAKTEFIENHWKTNGFLCLGAKIIDIPMFFQRFWKNR